MSCWALRLGAQLHNNGLMLLPSTDLCIVKDRCYTILAWIANTCELSMPLLLAMSGAMLAMCNQASVSDEMLYI